MLTLSLLRHAKSSWDHPSLADFDRPLAPRGLRAAPVMGSYLQRHALVPDLILCSAAQRTRETLGLILPYLEGNLSVRIDDALYNASTAEDLLSFLHRQADSQPNVLMIGHNPALELLAGCLVDSGASAARDQMAEKFPTAALAVISFKADNWAGVRGGGRLERFETPKGLNRG